MLTARRLPGIRIDVAPPESAQALPRMDVAVLVGFASTGPLHLPVPIESVAQYAAVFGADAPLAWDAIRGEPTSIFPYRQESAGWSGKMDVFSLTMDFVF